MRHEVSVDTDLDIRDGQLLEIFFFFLKTLVPIEYSLK